MQISMNVMGMLLVVNTIALILVVVTPAHVEVDIHLQPIFTIA